MKYKYTYIQIISLYLYELLHDLRTDYNKILILTISLIVNFTNQYINLIYIITLNISFTLFINQSI